MNEAGLTKLIADIREITHRYRAKAAIQLNATIIDERWEIGKRIVEEEQNGEIRAEYGANLLKELSFQLTFDLGKGYSPRALAYYRQLYIYFPDRKILQTRLQNLTWSHIQAILGEKNEKARLWYMDEAAQQMWSVKTLERNVGSQYYHRLLASSDKNAVSNETDRKFPIRSATAVMTRQHHHFFGPQRVGSLGGDGASPSHRSSNFSNLLANFALAGRICRNYSSI